MEYRDWSAGVCSSDLAGAGASTTAGAEPWEIGGDNFIDQSIGEHPHDFSGIPTIKAGCASSRAAVGAGAADKAVAEVILVQKSEVVFIFGIIHFL